MTHLTLVEEEVYYAALMYHLCSIAMILKYWSGTVEFTQTLSQAVFAPAIRNARRSTLITRQE